MDYYKYYIQKVEDNQFEKFDCSKATVELYSDIPIRIAADMSDNDFDLIIFE